MLRLTQEELNTELDGLDFSYLPQEESKSEMTFSDLQFLIYLLRTLQPRKVLEIGIAAGGTTAYILQETSAQTEVVSVDIAAEYYKDPQKPSGFLVAERCTPDEQNKWTTYLGLDISECVAEVTQDVDFCIIDTVHSLPGELLSFLSVLPYLKNGTCVVLHDIHLNCQQDIYSDDAIPFVQHTISNTILFTSVASAVKLTSKEARPNIGCFFLTEQTKANISSVFHALFLAWAYFPGEKMLADTRGIIAAKYPELLLNLYDEAVNYNRTLCLAKERKEREKISLHVAFALHDTDGNYARHVGACLCSVSANTAAPIIFHILHDQTLTRENAVRLAIIAEKFQKSIEFHYVDLEQAVLTCGYSQHPGLNRVSPATLYRLFLPETLPTVSRLIYLDADIIADLDVALLWAEDLQGYALGAVPDLGVPRANYVSSHDPDFDLWAKDAVPLWKDMGLDLDDYFNAGVLLLDMDKLRQGGQFKQAISLLARYTNFPCSDQDALNIAVLHQYKKLPFRFNAQLLYSPMATAPAIWHYYPKPWDAIPVPQQDRYYFYLEMTPWAQQESNAVLVDELEEEPETENAPKTFDFVILDDYVPQAVPGCFRNTEFISLLSRIQNSALASVGYNIAVEMPLPNNQNFGKEYDKFQNDCLSWTNIYPEFQNKVFYANAKKRIDTKLGYVVFLSFAYTYIKYLEKSEIPFVLEFYPGGLFCLYDEKSDAMCKRVFSSSMFRGVITTQPIITEYIISQGFVAKEQVFEILGGFSSLDMADVLPKRYYTFEKNTLDISFVAYQQLHGRLRKGYDIVLDVAKEICSMFEDVRFHIVGNWDPREIEQYPQLAGKMFYYGCHGKEFFPEFFQNIDISLNPCRPYCGTTVFDGFPLGIDAALCGAALFSADELDLNRVYQNDEIEIIHPKASDIIPRMVYYHEHPQELKNLAEKCAERTRDFVNIEKQIGARLDVFSKFYPLEIIN